MPSYMVAHIKHKGVDLVLVPLEEGFDGCPIEEQAALIAELRKRSEEAGLWGIVVPVWKTKNEHMKFVAPRNMHSLFKGVDVNWVLANVNRDLAWK